MTDKGQGWKIKRTHYVGAK